MTDVLANSLVLALAAFAFGFVLGVTLHERATAAALEKHRKAAEAQLDAITVLRDALVRQGVAQDAREEALDAYATAINEYAAHLGFRPRTTTVKDTEHEGPTV